MDIEVKCSLISNNSIMKILENYCIDVIQCQFLARGLNDSYIIRTEKESFIFRVYRSRWRDKEATLFELDAIIHLYEKSFKASCPIEKKNGDLLCEIQAPEGLRYGVLFSFAEGERPQINEENSLVIGATLGELHRLTGDVEINCERGFKRDTDHLLDEPAAIISPVVERYLGEEAVKTLEIVVENSKSDLAELDLETGFCHGDFHNHNMHIHNGEIEMFDFDCCAIGFRAYDIAVTWWNLKNNYKNLEAKCWDAFLEGYLNERKLAVDEFKSLPLFITARRIWLMGMMLKNEDVWGTNWINARTLDLFIWQLKTDRLGDEKFYD